MLGIGIVELVVLAVVLVSVLLLNRYGYLSKRWGFAFFGCAALGALITPADAFSMLTTTALLLCVYFAGSKHTDVSMRNHSA